MRHGLGLPASAALAAAGYTTRLVQTYGTTTDAPTTLVDYGHANMLRLDRDTKCKSIGCRSPWSSPADSLLSRCKLHETTGTAIICNHDVIR